MGETIGNDLMKITTTITGIYEDGHRINNKHDLEFIINHLKTRFEWHRNYKPNKFDR